jgi:hypothetical protein
MAGKDADIGQNKHGAAPLQHSVVNHERLLAVLAFFLPFQTLFFAHFGSEFLEHLYASIRESKPEVC